MNKLNELTNELKNSETIKRFKQLESIIDHDEILKKDYELLKKLQKELVQAETKKSANLSEIREEYNTQLEKVNQHVLLSEYVDLIQSINEDLQLIQTIITEEINMDID